MTAAVSTPETPATDATPSEPTRDDLVAIIEKARIDGGEGEAPSETPATEAPKEEPPPQPKKADASTSRMLVAKQALLRERQSLRAEREATEKAKAELKADLEKAERVRAAKHSPSDLIALSELSPKEFLEKLATEHDPQSLVTKAIEAERAEREKLQKKLDALEASREQDLKRAQGQVVEAQVREAGQAFIAHLEEAHEKYPHIVAEFSPDEAVQAALSALEEVIGHDESGKPVTRAEAYRSQHGEYPDDAAIAEYLEHTAQQKAQRKQAWKSRQSTLSQSAGEQANGQSNRAGVPRTLTNNAASQKAAAPKPWSQEDADKESLRIIQQLHARD